MGTLFVVATPIGNIEDITLRALRVLKEVDLIVCEDTRRTKILLDQYAIKTPTTSYHQHSKLQKLNFIIKNLTIGKNIALVSDAGTPGIDDPGGLLVSEAIKNNLKVVPIPGPSALNTALSVCGFSAQSFLFLGFLPKKKGRQTILRNLMKISPLNLYDLLVLYESPYRLIRTLQDLQLVVGNREIVLARELTKKFEEIFHGNIVEAIKYFSQHQPKGEFTLIVKTKS